MGDDREAPEEEGIFGAVMHRYQFLLIYIAIAVTVQILYAIFFD